MVFYESQQSKYRSVKTENEKRIVKDTHSGHMKRARSGPLESLTTREQAKKEGEQIN